MCAEMKAYVCVCVCSVGSGVCVIVFETHKTHGFSDSFMYRSVDFELSSKSKQNFRFSSPHEHLFVEFDVNTAELARLKQKKANSEKDKFFFWERL